MNVITTRLALTFHIHDRGAGPWRKPCLALHLLFVMPRFVRRSWWLHHCPRLAPRGSSVFAPACTPGSLAFVPPACTPGVFCCAAVLPAGSQRVVERTDAEQEDMHTRSRGLRVRGAGLSPRPGTLAGVLVGMRSAKCVCRAPQSAQAASFAALPRATRQNHHSVREGQMEERQVGGSKILLCAVRV